VSDFLLLHSRLYDLLTHAVIASRNPELADWASVSMPLTEIQDRVQRAVDERSPVVDQFDRHPRRQGGLQFIEFREPNAAGYGKGAAV
jgi:hypothetical protein